jgi:hypothetical protein
VGEAIGVVLPYAIGVAISPLPIIAVILVLFSARARVNGPVFLVGWVVGVTVVSVAVYLLSDAGDASTDDSASDTVSTAKLLLGVLLLVLAVRHLRAQRRAEATSEPKWMASIDSLTPVKAGGLGALLSGLNPKNLALSLAAGASLAQSGAAGGDAVAGLVAFIVVASLSIAVPVVSYLLGGQRAAAVLDAWRGWLSTHNDAVMAVLFLVFGVVLIGQGLQTS